jgi:hypothetical protein
VSRLWTYFALTALTALCVPARADAQGWLPGFSYRRLVTFSNFGGNYPDLAVSFTFSTASAISGGRMRSGCEDIRVTAADGVTVLPLWLESGCNGTSTRLWTKITSVTTSGIKQAYVYYGSPSAASVSDGSAVFDLFDDFTSFDSSRWDVVSSSPTGGTASVSGGRLNLETVSSSSDWVWLRSKATWGPGHWIEARMISTSSSPTLRLGLATSTSIRTDGAYYHTYSMDQYNDTSLLQRLVYRGSGTTTSTNWSVDEVSRGAIADEIWSVAWPQTAVQRGYVEYAPRVVGTDNTVAPPSAGYVYIGLAQDADGTAVVEWIRLRRYTPNSGSNDIMATAAVGGESGGTASTLLFAPQPGTVVVDQAIPSFEVRVVDSGGNLVTGGTGTVAIALGNNPSGALLSGTTSVALAGGKVTFSDLRLNKTATGVTLIASHQVLTKESQAFDVLATGSQSAAPQLLSSLPNLARCGEPFTYSDGTIPRVSGSGPLSFQFRGSPLPSGLAVDEYTGELNWTPSQDTRGTFEVSLVITGPGGSTTENLSLAVECQATGCGCDGSGGAVGFFAGALVVLAALVTRRRDPRQGPS